MTDNTVSFDRLFAALAAAATTFTLLVASFAPPAMSLTGVVA